MAKWNTIAYDNFFLMSIHMNSDVFAMIQVSLWM